MILLFRKQVYRNIFKIILWLTAGSMIVGAGLTTFLKKSSKRGYAIATVGGEDIDYRDFTRREKAKREQLSIMRRQFEQMGLPFDQSLFDIDSKKLAFSGLLEEVLLNRVVKALGMSLSEDYVGSKFMDSNYVTRELSEFFPEYFAVAQDFDGETLSRMLRGNGMNIADFESFVEHDLKRKVIKDIAVNAIYNPVFMLKRKYIQDYAAKKFSVAVFSLDAFLKDEKKHSPVDNEIKNFFIENSRQYAVPEKRSGIIWEFSPEKYGIEISDAMIRDYYEVNKNKYAASPVKIKVRRILFRVPNEEVVATVKARAEMALSELLKAPALFAEKVKDFSEDEATSKKGGVVDFFARGEMDQNFERAAFRLKQDGEISPLVQTRDGFEIIQRVERRPAEYKSLSSVSGDIRDLLTRQEFKHRFDGDVENILSSQRDISLAVDALARVKSAKQLPLKMLAREDSLKGDRLFKMQEGFSYYRDQDKGFVIQLLSVHKSHMPDLVAVRDQVIHDFYKAKAEKSLVFALNKARQRAESASFGDVVREFNVGLKTVDWVKNDDTGRIQALAKEGLPVAQMLQMEKAGALLAYHDGINACLVKLHDIEPVKVGELETKKTEIDQELLRSNSFVALNGFVASLARNVTLETHEKSLEIDQFDTEQA